MATSRGQTGDMPAKGPADTRSARRQVMQLHPDSPDVVVTTEEQRDRFVIEAAQAVSACQNHRLMESWQDHVKRQFNAFCDAISEWSVLHAQIGQAVLKFVSTEYVCEFITDDEFHDFSLDAEMAEFELVLNKQFPEFPCELSSVPAIMRVPGAEHWRAEEAIPVYARTS